MTNKSLAVAVAFLAVVIVVSGFAFRTVIPPAPAGSTVTYTASGNRLESYNLLSGIVTDLANLRRLNGAITATTSLPIAVSFPTATAISATSSLAGWSGLTAGDVCLITVASGTSQISQVAGKFDCAVTSATTILATFTMADPAKVSGVATSTAAVTYGVNVKVQPFAALTPTALNTATTTTPNN